MSQSLFQFLYIQLMNACIYNKDCLKCEFNKIGSSCELFRGIYAEYDEYNLLDNIRSISMAHNHHIFANYTYESVGSCAKCMFKKAFNKRPMGGCGFYHYVKLIQGVCTNNYD